MKSDQTQHVEFIAVAKLKMAELTEKLIEHVKNVVLYDMSHADYKNIRIKNKVWDEIAKEMGNYTGK